MDKSGEKGEGSSKKIGDDAKTLAKKEIRKRLIAERLSLPDRLQRADALQQIMRIWLVGRKDVVIGAYWPIHGEFDPLPALHRWKEDGELLDQPEPRRIGLPVVDKVHKTLQFHAWYPGCPMQEDAFGIPKPKETEVVVPTLLFVPCVATALAASGSATVVVFMTAHWPSYGPSPSPWDWVTPTATPKNLSQSRMTSRWMRS